MNALLLALALSAAPPPTPANLPFLRSKTQQKAELVETLKRNIQKVDHATKVTQDLIAHSRATPYLPDLQFRLAELYVEKSRYKYFLAAEEHLEREVQRPGDAHELERLHIALPALNIGDDLRGAEPRRLGQVALGHTQTVPGCLDGGSEVLRPDCTGRSGRPRRRVTDEQALTHPVRHQNPVKRGAVSCKRFRDISRFSLVRRFFVAEMRPESTD